MRTLFLALGTLALLTACKKGESPTPPEAGLTDTIADERAIRASIKRWHELIAAGDADAIALLFAEDGELMAPGQAAVSGREAVRRFWQSAVKTPDLSLTFEPQEIQFARGGDMALDRGTYRFQGTIDGKVMTETGKYVVIWRKVGKEWKIAADIWNSDPPPAA